MKKSIYSLVLADDVVAAADRLAYELHTSRSNLINQILAEHLSCVTPEMRMQAVFSRMECLREQFRVPEQTSAHMLSLQSRLDYKYKPTVQYLVELYRVPQEHQAGKLRVQLRTQNTALIEMLDRFFRFRTALEEQYLPKSRCHAVIYRIAPGRLERSLQNPGVDEETFGELLGEYIRSFDRYLKAWFAGIEDIPHTAAMLETAFAKEISDKLQSDKEAFIL